MQVPTYAYICIHVHYGVYALMYVCAIAPIHICIRTYAEDRTYMILDTNDNACECAL
jgi:hypothetical protein